MTGSRRQTRRSPSDVRASTRCENRMECTPHSKVSRCVRMLRSCSGAYVPINLVPPPSHPHSPEGGVDELTATYRQGLSLPTDTPLHPATCVSPPADRVCRQPQRRDDGAGVHAGRGRRGARVVRARERGQGGAGDWKGTPSHTHHLPLGDVVERELEVPLRGHLTSCRST